MKIGRALRMLIGACLDDERMLRHELKFVGTVRAEALGRLAKERGEFVAELRRLANPTRDRPNGSWTEMLREGMRSLWVGAAGYNSGDAIASCRRSHARTEARYEQALRTSWSDEMQRVVVRQSGRIHTEAHELVRLQF